MHGQALAGLGLLGSMVTPALVSSQSPNVWSLFGYLAIVLVANTAIARLRGWSFLAAAGFVGTGLWMLVYLSEAPIPDFTGADVHQPGDAQRACVHLAQRRRGGCEWLRRWPAIAPAFFLAMTAALLLAMPQYQSVGGVAYGAVLVFAMLLVAFYRPVRQFHCCTRRASPRVLVHAQAALTGTFALQFSGGELSADGFVSSPFVSALKPAGIILAIIFLVDGFWSAWRTIAASPAARGGLGGLGHAGSAGRARFVVGGLRQSRPGFRLRGRGAGPDCDIRRWR